MTIPPKLKMLGLGVGFVFVFLVVVVGIVYLAKPSKEKEQDKAEETNLTNSVSPATMTTEALVLTYEGYTPCSVNIDYRAKIQRYGRPLTVKYPGIVQPITYSGESDTNAPPGVWSGEFFFTSPDHDHPHILVRVYKKIQVQMRP